MAIKLLKIKNSDIFSACAKGLFLFCFALFCFTGMFSWVKDAGVVTYELKHFQCPTQPDWWPPIFYVLPLLCLSLYSYQYLFIYYSWAILISFQIPNPRTSASPVPLLQNLHMPALASEQMCSRHRGGFHWPSLLSSGPHLCSILSILLPWLILLTARSTLWNYFSYVFSFLFTVYFCPGKYQLYEAGIFLSRLWYFWTLQQCLHITGF